MRWVVRAGWMKGQGWYLDILSGDRRWDQVRTYATKFARRQDAVDWVAKVRQWDGASSRVVRLRSASAPPEKP